MDDLKFGTRNKRGDWAPSRRLELAPFWTDSSQPDAVGSWLLSYWWPWNALFLALAVAWWRWVLPDFRESTAMGWGWALRLLLANWLGILAVYGLLEWRYYRRRIQASRFKYNSKFPSEQPSAVFWFKSQNLDNFLRSFVFSIPIGTALEVLILQRFASGSVVWLRWDEHPLYLAGLVLLAPLIHEAHFFVIHRTIHWGPLYRWVHSVHHNSVNPSPWSSLSMHPVESAIYFAVMAWALAIPSHPFLVLYWFSLAGFGAVVGHIGFDRLEFTPDHALSSHAHAHYLHHKYFEVNYCDDGILPLDRWFGTWHDGSADGDRLMAERLRRKRQRVNA